VAFNRSETVINTSEVNDNTTLGADNNSFITREGDISIVKEADGAEFVPGNIIQSANKGNKDSQDANNKFYLMIAGALIAGVLIAKKVF